MHRGRKKSDWLFLLPSRCWPYFHPHSEIPPLKRLMRTKDQRSRLFSFQRRPYPASESLTRRRFLRCEWSAARLQTQTACRQHAQLKTIPITPRNKKEALAYQELLSCDYFKVLIFSCMAFICAWMILSRNFSTWSSMPLRVASVAALDFAGAISAALATGKTWTFACTARICS